MQSLAGWKFCASFCAINTFFIGVCWYVETCINDIQTIFNEIELHLMARDDCDENAETNLRKFAIRRSLLEAVEFHNRILEYVALGIPTTTKKLFYEKIIFLFLPASSSILLP